MKYFNMLPKISYAFDTGDYNVVDIFTRAAFNNNFFNNTELYYEEQRQEQLSPDRTSFEKYQTFDYYWLLMLANKIYDVNSDWPTNQMQLSDVLESYSNKKVYYIYEHAEIVPNDILYITEDSYGVVESWNPFYRELVIKEEYGVNLPTTNLSTYSFEIRRLNIDGTYFNVTNYCNPQTAQFTFFGYKPYLEAPYRIKNSIDQILNPFLKVINSYVSPIGQSVIDSCSATDKTEFANTLIYKIVNNESVNDVTIITNNQRLLSEYVDKTKINIINPTIASMYEDKIKLLFDDPNSTATTVFRIG